MAQADVIREFLVKLGFKVDQKSLNDFSSGVEGATKAVEALVSTVVGASLAIGAGVTAFAAGLDQMYFSSKRVNENISDLKAFGNAAKNFGVDAGEAASNIESFAGKMRNQPGFESWLQSLGINTRSNGVLRDTADLMVDMGRALEKYPQYMRSQYAAQAGMSERMILALTDPRFGGEFGRQQGLVGNIDAASEVTRKFNVQLQDLENTIKKALLPVMVSLTKITGELFADASRWAAKNADGLANAANGVATAVTNMGRIMMQILGKSADGWKLIYELVKDTGVEINKILPSGWGDKIGEGTNWLFEKLGIADTVYDMVTGSKTAKTTAPARTTTQADKAAYLEGLDKKYGLPPGTLYKYWMAESGGGKHMLSNKGAEGHFQFMPGTAKEYGVNNPYNFEESADGAGRYISSLKKKYGGDMRTAAAAWNWGPGNVDRYGLGHAPRETQGFMDKVAGGVNVNQTTTINVNGAGDPAAVGREVARQQNYVNADILRNMKTAVQ